MGIVVESRDRSSLAIRVEFVAVESDGVIYAW
jgi:hypothetical protein